MGYRNRQHRWVAVALLLSIIVSAFPFSTQFVQAADAERPLSRVYLDPSINKKFVPISIPPGGTSRLTVYVYNPNDYGLVNVAWTDQLEKIQPGIVIANNPLPVSTCGGIVSAVPGSNIFSLTGGTVGPKVGVVNGECQVSVNVTSFTPGNLDNEFVPGDLTAQDIPEGTDPVHDFTNPTGVIETLNVADMSDPSISKYFSPDSVWVGQRTRLRVYIYNNDANYALHDVSLTDSLPADMEIADPLQTYIHPNCGGSATLTASIGATSFTINDADIPASSTCYYDVYVVSNTETTKTNTIDASTLTSYEQVTNPGPASDTIYTLGVQMYKSFSPDRILAGEDTMTLTITIQNPYTEKLTNAALSDALPGGQLEFIPGTEATTCEEVGTPATITFTDANHTINISDATVPAGVNVGGVVTIGSCTITVDATAPGSAGGGAWSNSLPPGTLTNDEDHTNQNTAQDWFYIDPQSIAVYKTFNPTRFEENGQTTVRIRLTNPTATAITGVDLTDELPTNMLPIIPAVTSTTCGGTVTVDEVSDPKSITLTGGTIPADSSCYFEAAVTYTTSGTPNNCVLANTISTDGGITNLTQDCESVTVYPTNLGVTATKTFSTNGRLPSEFEFYVDLRFTAPQDETLTNVGIVDDLPAGLVISNPTAPSISGCGTGYSISAPDGGSTFSLSGGTINAGSSCSIRLYIEALYPGTFTNELDPLDFTNDSDQTFPNTPSDTITITDFRVSKSFSLVKIARTGKTVLTVTMYNDNDAAIVDGTLNDRLNSMGTGEFLIADPANFTSTCPGYSYVAAPGTNTIYISDLQINPNSSCTYSVTIEAQNTATIGNNTNTIARTDGSVQWSGIPGFHLPRDNASATLTIATMDLDVVKNFDPSAVFGGSSSKMSILLINPNDIDLTQISFDDFMPVGMEAAQPYNIDTSTCGGTVTIAPDQQSFTYSGGSLAANRRCTISLNATIRVNGNLVNTIPAGAVTTYEGVTNPDPASSTLTNLPGISVQKYFTPNQILADPAEYSTLTLFFRNTGNAPVTNMGLIDAFPAGMYVADGGAPAPTSDCGGTLTADPYDTELVLVGGGLAGAGLPGDTCTLTVSVEADDIGAYRNTIAEGDVTSDDPNGTNPDPSEDTLIVYGTPAMEISKDVSNLGTGSGAGGIFIEGDTIAYTILVANTGDILLPNVTVTDPGTDVTLTGCTPLNGSDLAVDESMTCTAEHIVTADDILAGSFTNTAFADSDKTDPVSDDEVVPLSGGPAMNIDKRTTSSPPYLLNSTITYQIIVRNIGTITLNNVTVTDPGTDVVLGVCAPVNGSSLPVGGSMTCTATHVVTQADIDAGSFSNTAYADSDETTPVDDTVTVPVSQFPGLAVYKYETSSGIYAVSDMVDFEIVVQNTGNTTLTNVTVTDTGTELPLGDCTKNEDPTVIAMPTTLLVGEKIYCEAFHEVTQADIDAGEYTNVAFADSDETAPESAEETVTMVQIPMITVVKTGTVHDDAVAPAGRVDEGDTITYTFRVENTGNVTLSDVSITDAVAGVVVVGGPITMAPGEVDTTTFTASYSIQQADIDAGTFTNTATVSGEDPNGHDITDDDDDTKTFTRTPAIELEKTGTLDLDSTAPSGIANPGDVITYAFTVRNTGNVTLTDINLNDSVGGVTIFGGPIASLAPGDEDTTTFTGTYAITQTDIDAGTFHNAAEVTGTPPAGDDVTDDDDHDESIPQVPSIELEKTGALDMTVVAPNTRADVGDEINYTFTVTNTGNVTLTDVTITDSIGGVTISGGPISLDPGESDTTTFTGSYALTQTDIDAGHFYNEADVTGTPPIGADVTDDDDHDEPITQEPSIELVKTGTLDMTVVLPTTRADVGDEINYTFTVTNTGNVTLTNITLLDTVGGVTITGGPILSLDPGDSDNTTFSGSYTLTQSDVDAGHFYNEAQVTGTPPVGDDVTDDDDHDQPITDVPSIGLVKTGTLDDTVVAPSGEPNVGDVINYTFTVTNTGNVTLTNITLADTVGGVTLSGGPIASLDPGDSDNTTFTGSYTLTQTDIDAGHFYNEAQVTGTPPVGGDVTDEDDHDEPLDQNPGISLVKTGVLDLTAVAPNTRADVGDQINYTFTVTNTGNVTLTNVDITDIVPGVVISGGPITLDPDEVDSTTFTAVYTLTVADLDAGTFTNTATVTGEDPNTDEVSDDDPDTQTLPADPSILLEKSGSVDDTVVAPSGRIDVGDQINYVFTVTNTGNVTLTGITVTDTIGGVTVSGTIASLAPGASDNTSITGVYTLTQTDIDAGTFHNEAEVEGTDPNDTVVTDDDDHDQPLTQVPLIQLEKIGTLDDTVVAPSGQVNAGDQITYTFTVTNTGNVTLTNITLADTVGGVTITGGPIATLAPGASDGTTFTGEYTLTQADVDAGSFHNEAEVTGKDPAGDDVTDDDDDDQTFRPEPSIDLQKIGTLDETVVPLPTRADEGDVIDYVFRIENTGNVTLYNITVTDTVGGVTVTGGPIASLAPGAVDDTTISGSYTLTLADVDSGSFYNEAHVASVDPNDTPVEDDDDDQQSLVDDGTLGIAKDVITGPTQVTPGVWHFTYQLYIENAGNVTLTDVQVTDDLRAVFGTMFFQVLEVRSDDFTLNPLYDGDLDVELLDGTDVLLPGEYGYIEIDVEFIPENRGPFENTATVVGTNPSDEEVTDDSQDGVDPDPDGDDDPTNNNEPTPLDFPPYIFDPPFGIKVFDNAGMPLLRWTMIWINGSNIVPLYSRVSDPIPQNTTFYDDGIPSGYALPAGPHPDGTTTNGVVCGPEEGYTGTSTTTTYCYYEGPTLEYPRGRIVWEGTIGPDLGAEDELEATNELYITFSVRVRNVQQDVNNTAELGADIEGDGDIEGDEIVVAEASETWHADDLPDTGFAPGMVTVLPTQPAEKSYGDTGIVVEIPSLGIQANLVTVPFEDGTWDVTWLGNEVGYLEGSAYPTWQGNTVLTAHNWTAYNQPGLFAAINSLSYGDKILIHAFGMTYTYEMRSSRYVISSDLKTVFQHEELDWVTLMTCFGFDQKTGEYRYRFLVRAVLVGVE